MTEGDINGFNSLDKDGFEYREWLALKYARDWAASGGASSDDGYMADFKSQYTEQERGYILKLIRLQDFANHFMNTFGG